VRSAHAEVIQKPAERFGLELEPGLSEKIVEDVHSADALPLLAYTLKELNDRGGEDRCLTLDEYQNLGGVQGAIASKLEAVLSDPEPTEEENRALPPRVHAPSDPGEGAVEGERLPRRVGPRTSLPPSADRILRRLVDAGLLTTKNGTIELAHDVITGTHEMSFPPRFHMTSAIRRRFRWMLFHRVVVTSLRLFRPPPFCFVFKI
jgi:conflict system STAND superfamily ATPase